MPVRMLDEKVGVFTDGRFWRARFGLGARRRRLGLAPRWGYVGRRRLGGRLTHGGPVPARTRTPDAPAATTTTVASTHAPKRPSTSYACPPSFDGTKVR